MNSRCLMKTKQEDISLSERIKAEAMSLGFSACGIARAERVSVVHENYLLRWLECGKQADMRYMENYLSLRLDPRVLHPGTCSVISVAMAKNVLDEYADYHKVIRKKLRTLLPLLNSANEGNSDIKHRICVDSAPILERYWAQQAGIGWIGKHHNLIVPDVGSLVMLGEILTPLVLDYDSPMQSRCGECQLCIEACKGNVLRDLFDTGRCVSYLTIEDPLLGEHRRDYKWAKKNGKPYGCEACQMVCPFN